MSETITVTLTAYNMGDVDEVDFDLWRKFVCENIDDAMGFEVQCVDQFEFPGGPARDRIDGATDVQREAIASWLATTGWEAFCGETWERMRREHDAETAVTAAFRTSYQKACAAGLDNAAALADAREQAAIVVPAGMAGTFDDGDLSFAVDR